MLSTAVTLLRIRSSDLTHLTDKSLFLSPTPPYFSHLPAPGNYFHCFFVPQVIIINEKKESKQGTKEQRKKGK